MSEKISLDSSGIQTLNEALMEAQTLGRKWEDERRQLRNKVFSLI